MNRKFGAFAITLVLILSTGCTSSSDITIEEYDSLNSKFQYLNEVNIDLKFEIDELNNTNNELIKDSIELKNELIENREEISKLMENVNTLEKQLDNQRSQNIEGFIEFETKIAESENEPHDSSRIIKCLTANIGIVYYNLESFEIQPYVLELQEIILNSDLSSREYQIAYELLADFQDFKR
ncbi:hypothetical protein [Fusibacter sp. JL216-2]|uniref:hypothetical protein n=1 Tax=Fusibacter sp. JL216-2 TaxID=3071453 RepID=UPI003D34E0C9